MDERTMAGLEDEDEDGVSFHKIPLHHHLFPRYASEQCSFCFFLSQDTDSLMEWWYTVERKSQTSSKEQTQKSELLNSTNTCCWIVFQNGMRCHQTKRTKSWNKTSPSTSVYISLAVLILLKGARGIVSSATTLLSGKGEIISQSISRLDQQKLNLYIVG